MAQQAPQKKSGGMMKWLIIGIIVIVVIGAIASTAKPKDPAPAVASSTPTTAVAAPTRPPVPITYDEIKAQHKALTEAQWETYKATIPGKQLTASGFVYDVKKAAFDDKLYDVQVTLDDPNKPLDTYELLFSVPGGYKWCKLVIRTG